MDKLKVTQHKTSFDAIAKYIENGEKEQAEIWFARELQPVLGYARWKNFVTILHDEK
jgi:DNA-damage-inducible protein D